MEERTGEHFGTQAMLDDLIARAIVLGREGRLTAGAAEALLARLRAAIMGDAE